MIMVGEQMQLVVGRGHFLTANYATSKKGDNLEARTPVEVSRAIRHFLYFDQILFFGDVSAAAATITERRTATV